MNKNVKTSVWSSNFLVAAIAMLLASCATANTVINASPTAGISQTFAGDYETVKAAALTAVERLNVSVSGTDEDDERFQIRFSKAISAFSWGEVGVVNVIKSDAQETQVFVNSEKRSQLQITGTAERKFAEEIFQNIEEALQEIGA